MDITDDALFVDDHLGRHPAEFQEVYLLAVQICNPMFWIWDPGERHVVFFPVFCETIFVFRTNGYNYSVFFFKQGIVLAQLRHMRSAVGSEEAPVEDEEKVLLTKITG